MAFHGVDPIRAKIIVEQKLLFCSRSAILNMRDIMCLTLKNDVVNKLRKFNHMWGTIRRTLKSSSKETHLKFYKVMARPVLMGLRIGLIESPGQSYLSG